MTQELKPCPFCGGAGRMHESERPQNGREYFVTCSACKGNCAKRSSNKEDAAIEWNRRPDLAASAPAIADTANCATCGAVGTVTSTKARCTLCGMFADTAGAKPVSTEQERERFESAWRAEYPMHSRNCFMRSHFVPNGYVNTRVNDGWLMWQARAALASPAIDAAGASEGQSYLEIELEAVRADREFAEARLQDAREESVALRERFNAAASLNAVYAQDIRDLRERIAGMEKEAEDAKRWRAVERYLTESNRFGQFADLLKFTDAAIAREKRG